jgi:AraC-like DNA-binding protein
MQQNYDFIVRTNPEMQVHLYDEQECRAFIETHHLRLRTIEDVAAECDVTSMYVARLFRRFGQSGAYQFLLKLKMSHAAALLQDEGLMVSEVASRLGFADAFQFSRAFKRVHGVAPSRMFHESQ